MWESADKGWILWKGWLITASYSINKAKMKVFASFRMDKGWERLTLRLKLRPSLRTKTTLRPDNDKEIRKYEPEQHSRNFSHCYIGIHGVFFCLCEFWNIHPSSILLYKRKTTLQLLLWLDRKLVAACSVCLSNCR